MIYPLIYGENLKNPAPKIKRILLRIFEWRASRFSQALIQIENIYLAIQQSRKATWGHVKQASKEMLYINIFHPDLYFLVIGMGLMVYVTRSFTEYGVDYGPWRPVVVCLASIMAGTVPMLVSVVLFPLHILLKVNTWVLTAANVVLSANIFAFLEPAIPNYFYERGVLGYHDLFHGILVFYALALSYLHMRLSKYYCFTCYLKRHETEDINRLLPANIRGNIISLSAKDHYVRIITDKGEHMVRMSMKDTISLLPPESGMLVHRSHWVSYNAMFSLSKNAERFLLKLRNGTQIPVSKVNVPKVKKILDAR